MMTPQTQGNELGGAFQEMRRGMLNYIRRKVSDGDVAEDLLQDVFLKALVAEQSKDPPRNLAGWLYGIANNAIVDYYRARRPTEAVPDDLPAVEGEAPRIPDELSVCVKPLLRVMPSIYGDTLTATDIEGRTMQEVSRSLSLSVSAVKSRASRGRKLLKDLMMDRCNVEIAQNGDVEYVPAAMGRCGGRGCG